MGDDDKLLQAEEMMEEYRAEFASRLRKAEGEAKEAASAAISAIAAADAAAAAEAAEATAAKQALVAAQQTVQLERMLQSGIICRWDRDARAGRDL